MNFGAILVFLSALKIGKNRFRFCSLLILIFALVSQYFILQGIVWPAVRFIYNLMPAFLAGEVTAFVVMVLLANVIWFAFKSRRVLREVAELIKLAF
ncbi:hypothetical protein M2404_000582 [Rheinheimera pacifica]|uniref:hypothetical protein n=1 Tax=Rheinheimera pacifica TaxID=173990 RepID=UPI00216A7644|nr:hypothetical protein [Rheinheimera pacifica]MCS4306269.1 hypothetical protein [Rheinheimera pacifica]